MPPDPGSTDVLHLGIDHWLVWDGVYWPLRVGHPLLAPLEFAGVAEVVDDVDPSAPSVHHLGRARYRAIATVVASGDVVVLDFGPVRAYRWTRYHQSLQAYETGSTLRFSEVHLGLNPFFGQFSDVEAQHALACRWTVETITSHEADGRIRDLDEASSDTVEPDGGLCVLECRLMGH